MGVLRGAVLVLGLVLTVPAAVVLLVLVPKRLLGIKFGVLRTVLAGLLGYLVSAPVARSFAARFKTVHDPWVPVWFLFLLVACIVLVAMIALVISEALAPTGSLPGPVELVKGIRGRIRRSRRYFQITRIAIRHGLGPYLRGRTPAGAPTGRARLATSLREALDEGGVTFVKLGQVMATRRDLLPVEYVDELRLLQDQATPAPWPDVRRVLEAELGAPVDQAFTEFDREPLAAASIAQVHAAVLPTGERVVVKIQRPDIADLVDRDLDIVARLAGTVAERSDWGRSIGVRELAAGFAAAVREELDFRIEAANMSAVTGAQDASAARVRYPTPYLALCTRRVLVMQRLDGTPLSAAAAAIADRGVDGTELARDLLGCLLTQIMVDGVFHADPHPGNVLLLPEGRLGLLDFGSVGRLDASLRAALQRLLIALDRGDPLGASDALLEVVTRPDEIDEVALQRALGQFMARHLARGAPAGLTMFTDLFKIVTAYRLSVPPEVAAVFRTLATVQGTLANLAPEFNLVAEARTFAGHYLAGQVNAGTLRDAVTDELVSLLPMLRRLPRRIERIAAAAESGRLTVNVRLFGEERDRHYLTGIVQQVLVTALSAAAGIMAVLLLGTSGGPPATRGIGLYQLFGYSLLVVAAVLALRVLVLVFRRDR